MAFLPTENVTDNKILQVGCIQKFIKHRVRVHCTPDDIHGEE